MSTPETSNVPAPPSPGNPSPGNLGGLILIGVVVVVVLALRFSGPSTGGDQHPLVGTRLGQLSIKPLTDDAQPLSADGLLGKVTLINFWGTWCGPCQVELPELVQIDRQFRSEATFQFVSVTIPQGPGTTEEALTRMSARRLAELGAEFGFYADEGTMTHLAFLSGQMGLGIPTTVIVDPHGTIVGMWTGFRRGDEKQMAETIRTALTSANT